MKKYVLFLCLFPFLSFAQKKAKKDYLVTLETNFGTTHLILFDDTPLHKANFIQLVQEKFYDGLLFHRVIPHFMIQGGDPNSRNALPETHLGNGGSDREKIPYEFTAKHVHTKGALAAARDGNPERKSNAAQFYLVEGNLVKEKDLELMAQRTKMDYTKEQIDTYASLGGYPSLDNNYTVFGQAIDNLDLIAKIAAQPRDAANRPKENISMKMTVKLMRKKKISKMYGYVF